MDLMADFLANSIISSIWLEFGRIVSDSTALCMCESIKLRT